MAAEIIEVILDIAKEVFDLVSGLDNEQHQREIQWTQDFVQKYQERNPNSNILVVHDRDPYEVNFANSVQTNYQLPIPGPFDQTQGYNIYHFDSGTINYHGDGTFVNWCFAGNYQRSGDGGHFVTFSPIQQPSQPTPPQYIPAFRSNPDGVYFVNCSNGTTVSSGLAYYKNIGNNDGHQPDDYIDVSHGSYTTWETSGVAVFKNGTKFVWNIDAGAQQNNPLYTFCGTANNTYHPYNVFKDRQRVLYTIDGWECTTIYWCY